ncbi:MAG: hypothetical protein JOY62_15255 [Acidobacteriaceae bacterium]|nr:hypothetical protein [Acidobacteriaceae bacterium]MBV9781320.1 hypothetical protein [Acidobacteriaceae bacterium]
MNHSLAELPTASPELTDGSPSRAEINRANAQHSTGPRTDEGKRISSQNSFKHGLYSKQLVLPNESAAELDELRAKLRSEHQPVNTTEEILVNEIAENFWRLRRMRSLETHTMQRTDFSQWLGMLPTIHRAMASAERSLHKALSTLRQLQRDRGFVPQPVFEQSRAQKQAPSENGFVSQNEAENPLSGLETGFVSQEIPDFASPAAFSGQFVSQNGHDSLAEAA